MAADFDLDLGPALRDALIADSGIASNLSTYISEPAIFTRRPIPDEVEFPMILLDDPAAIGDEDGLNTERPIWMGDVKIYGRKGAPGSDQDQTRIVQTMALRVRALFHRQKWALQVGGFHVIDIRASGPVPAPVDDDKTIGRVISLIVRLGRN